MIDEKIARLYMLRFITIEGNLEEKKLQIKNSEDDCEKEERILEPLYPRVTKDSVNKLKRENSELEKKLVLEIERANALKLKQYKTIEIYPGVNVYPEAYLRRLNELYKEKL
jgi:hypothetical protein